ncbi:uncharacterized protein LOC103857796 isoform X2 [Brassica rapa]|uniref:uncharacterized protein LOC103857796 isoform X2 n=1 Tax=Brassica campestris TaxID=3711 RepID=UPI0004F196CE|nr:uncharacterized protein LOC103857796 isoform X2 [Brassica rapa]
MALHILFVLFSHVLLTQVVEGNTDDFDCVDIYKQPAFQHPLLKHHKIQEIFYPDENLDRKGQYKTNYQSCPKGKVPILKQRNGTKSVHLDTVEYPGQHFATIETVLDGSIYRGAEANISLHSLTLQNNQFSKSQIWLENGPRNELNSIQVGWGVHPRLYGDTRTRFTMYWTDGLSGNWGLKIFNEVIGYWPKELFTHLNDGASLIRFGGNTFMSPDGISPPMGNGHFPVIDFQKSSFFLHVKVRNSNYQLLDIEDSKTRLYSDSFQCYRLSYWGYAKSNGVSFSFGGLGGDCGT